MILIREMTEEDLPGIAALDRSVFPEDPWGEETFRKNLENSFDHCFAAETEAGLSGYAVLRTLDTAELLLIGVSDALWQRKKRKEAGP